MITHDYFQHAQKVDVHNHRRQGALAMERCIHTRDWSMRLVTTLLGIIAVDSYMLYKSERGPDDAVLAFADFLGNFAGELAANALVDGRARQVEHVDEEPTGGVCSLSLLKDVLDTSHMKGRNVHRRCSVCHEQAYYCCAPCSTGFRPTTICGPGAKRPRSCFAEHSAKVAREKLS